MYINSANNYVNQNGSETMRSGLPFGQKEMMPTRLDLRKVPGLVNRALIVNKNGQMINNFASRFVDIQEKFYVEEIGGSEAASVCSSLSSSFSSISPTSTPLSYEALRTDDVEQSSPIASISSLSPQPIFSLANKEPVWSSLLYSPNLHPSLFNPRNDEIEAKPIEPEQPLESNIQASIHPNSTVDANYAQIPYDAYYPNTEYSYYPAPAEYYPTEYEEPVYYYETNSYQEFYPEMNQDISKPVYNNNMYNYQPYQVDAQYYYEGAAYYHQYKGVQPGPAYQYKHQYQASQTKNNEERTDQFYEEMNRKVNDIVENEPGLDSEMIMQPAESFDAKFRSIPEFYPSYSQFYNKNQFEQSGYKNYPMPQFVPGYSNKPQNYQTGYETSNSTSEFVYHENVGLKKATQNYPKPGVFYPQSGKQQQPQTIQQQSQQQSTSTNNFTKRGKNNVSQMKQRKKYCKCTYNCACGTYANEGGTSPPATNTPTPAVQYQAGQNGNNSKYRYRAVSKSRA